MSVAQQRGMYGTLKQFDRDSHNTYDSAGKDAVKSYLDKVFAGLKVFRRIGQILQHIIDARHNALASEGNLIENVQIMCLCLLIRVCGPSDKFGGLNFDIQNIDELLS